MTTIHVIRGAKGNGGLRGRALTPAEWAEAARVADRLKAELHSLIESLPEHARYATGLSRELGVLRVTCQRVVGALSGDTSALMLAKLPGVEGLRQFVKGFMRAGVDKGAGESALSAIEAFERLIETTGGSQTRLAERLQLSGRQLGDGEPAAEGGLATLEDRESLYACGVRVTGRSCDVALSVYAFRPDPRNPAMLERALAKGLIGSVVTPGGLPMVMRSGDTVRGEEEARQIMLAGGEAATGRTPEAILKNFTTNPLPMVTSRGRGGTLFQVIDPKAGKPGEPIDVVTAVLGRHLAVDPHTGKPTLDAVWSLVNCPSRNLILDVYLHASMERMYRPSMDALLWSASLDVTDDEKWAMRLPAPARLQMLGRGLAHAGSPLWARHGEMTAYFFDHVGWDANEFIGFRCEAEYPVWRAGYCMGFEYLSGTHPTI
jgi:hypothetical protein